MKILGKVHCVCELVQGESSNGQPWEKQTLVIDTSNDASKPRYTAIEFMGEKKTAVTKLLQPGDIVEATFGIICTEWKGENDEKPKWFTKLDGYGVRKFAQTESSPEGEE